MPQLCRNFGKKAVLAVALSWSLPFQMHMQAQQQAANSGTTDVGEVTASEQNGQVQINIAIGGPAVRPRISRLADPDRLVLNFPGAIPRLGPTRTPVSKGLVSAVRTALFETDESGRP